MGIQERKEREKQQRREDILDAAERVFADKGVDHSTMDDVAEESELSKGTLYLYFKTKDELFFGVTARGFSILANLFAEALEQEGTGLQRARRMGEAYLAFFRRYPTYYAGLSHYGGAEVDWEDHSTPNAAACHDLGDQVLGYLEKAIRVGIDDGSLRHDLNPMLTTLWLWVQLSGIIQFISTGKGEHIAKEYGLSAEQLVETSFELAVRAIAK
jgi:AcrR family transcriptional regulator